MSSADHAQLTIVVVDPSGATIPHAVVTLVPAEAGDTLPAMALTLESREGRRVVSLPGGAYQLLASAEGFEQGRRDVTLRPRQQARIEIRLALQAVSEAVLVAPTPQDRSLDGRGFSTFLSREQIEALPDDPAALEQALRDLAPPGAVLRVDGFTGGALPPKSQILSIRLPRLDTFAAQEHGGLLAFSAIDIVTRPGGGVVQGSVDAMTRAGGFGARHPLASARTREALATGGVAFDGPLVRERLSFAAAARLTTRRETVSIAAALPGGQRVEEGVVQPLDVTTFSGRVAAALPHDQTLRGSFSSEISRAPAEGVGGFNLRDRAYDATSADRTLRVALGGPVTRRGLIESRVQLRWSGRRTRPELEAPTIRVVDAFTSGGAQVAGGERTVELQAATDIDYASGGHAWRAGVLVDAGTFAVRRRSNYLGTFVFPSMEAYVAGAPAFFTRRVGDGRARYHDVQAGAYLQDDYRLTRSVLLSYGVRFETQAGIDDAGLLPRVSATWSPFRTGRTTVRGSWGLFREWVPRAVLETVRLVDGIQQWDVRIANPGYPQPGGDEEVAPRERYLMDPNVGLSRSRAASLSVEQQLGRWRLLGTVSVRRNAHLLRGLNLNAPIDGQRPDESAGNIIETRSDASARVNSLLLQGMYTDPRRRFDLFATYMRNGSESNTAGPFTVPATGLLHEEWGATDARHAATATATLRVRRFTVTMTPRWRGGMPYSLLLGDTDQDGFYDDRPAGVGRHTARTPVQFELGGRLAYGFRFGPSREQPPISSAGVDLNAARAGIAGSVVSDVTRGRYSIELYAQVQNATNRTNVVAVSGLVGSPSFGRALAAAPPRTIDVGLRFGF